MTKSALTPVCGLVCVWHWVCGGIAAGATFSWNDTAGGVFCAASNWSPAGGPPNNSFDVAVFDLFAVYDVALRVNVTNRSFEVTSGTVTLDLFGENAIPDPAVFTYTLVPTLGMPAAKIGSVPGALFPASLVVTGDGVGGAVDTSGRVEIGSDANSSGSLQLGFGVRWDNSSTTYVGRTGDGVLAVFGTLENLAGVVGEGSGSSGDVTVRGTWTNTGGLTVGGFGDATVAVSGFTGMVSSVDAEIAAQAGSTSSVAVTDLSDWENTGSLYVGGTSVAAGGNGTLTLDKVDLGGGGTVNVVGQLKLWPGGTVVLTSGILSAGSLTGDGSMNWTTGAVNITGGDFTIDSATPLGADEELNEFKALDVVGALKVAQGGPGTVTVVNGRVITSGAGVVGNETTSVGAGSVQLIGPGSGWTITNDLRVGGRDAASLEISAGAVVENADALVAIDPSASGDVLVTDAGTQWTSSGSVSLGGDASTLGGSGTTQVLAGAAIQVAGPVRVWDGYTLTIDGGTVATPTLHVSGTVNVIGELDLTGSGTVLGLVLDGGAITADVIDFGGNSFSGFGTLQGTVLVGGDVQATGPLTLGDASQFDSVQIAGDLNVGAQDVTVNALGFFPVGASTNLTGGVLTVPGGVAIAVGGGLVAHGTVDGRVVQQSGSIVITTDDLALGDPSSTAGFFSDGEMMVGGGHRVTLLDANEVVLGSLTILGSASLSGAVAAANGAVLEFGKNIMGFGAVETPDDPTRPLINNGSIAGDSAGNPITLNGYVKGVGTLDHVVITGTDAPGFSPVTVYRGSVAYQGTLEIEIGGTAPGSFDRTVHSGTATLGGALQASLIDGYVPTAGDSFVVIDADELAGVFDEMVLPALPPSLFWRADTDDAAGTVTLRVCGGDPPVPCDEEIQAVPVVSSPAMACFAVAMLAIGADRLRRVTDGLNAARCRKFAARCPAAASRLRPFHRYP